MSDDIPDLSNVSSEDIMNALNAKQLTTADIDRIFRAFDKMARDLNQVFQLITVAAAEATTPLHKALSELREKLDMVPEWEKLDDDFNSEEEEND